MKNVLFLVSFVWIVQTAQAQLIVKVYEAPETEAIVQQHRKIAILPMKVTMRDTKSSKKNRMSAEDLQRMEESYREGFQNSMYSWFLNRN